MNAPFELPDGNVAANADFPRWSSFGPYYAMFPVDFARSVVSEYTSEGDGIFDPFSGRGTSIFCAAELGRRGIGVELNPLGWLYGTVKLNPGRKELVLARLTHIDAASGEFQRDAEALPEFFHRCFCEKVRSFLVAARSLLNWSESKIDRTLMGFILVYLHGKIERGRANALSNQMRQTKAMAPDYSIRWWTKNGMADPPTVNPADFLRKRIEWRYEKGKPTFASRLAEIRQGDCRTVTPRIRSDLVGSCRLLLTSPPYCGVTSYYYDQWLRFWMLGDLDRPTTDEEWKGKFANLTDYQSLLDDAFSSARRMMAEDAVIYVRTDKRPNTLDATLSALDHAFPEWSVKTEDSPFPRDTQTALFGDRSKKPGEVDVILHR